MPPWAFKLALFSSLAHVGCMSGLGWLPLIERSSLRVKAEKDRCREGGGRRRRLEKKQRAIFVCLSAASSGHSLSALCRPSSARTQTSFQCAYAVCSDSAFCQWCAENFARPSHTHTHMQTHTPARTAYPEVQICSPNRATNLPESA